MNKFSSNIEYLRQYVNGELTPTEMYEIERAMHDDEMLMDIIEGLEAEKALKSSTPTVELHSKIKARAKHSSPTKVFNLKKHLVAASILAICTLGGVYFFYTDSPSSIDGDQPIALEQQHVESPIGLPEVEDSNLVTFSGKDSIEKETSIVKSKVKSSKIESTDPIVKKKLLVYQAKPKMQVVIEGPKYLNKENKEEEVIIATMGSNYIPQPQSELLSAKVGSSQQPKNNISYGKLQAELQKLDIDPQTKANLSTILSRQAMDNNTEIKEKQTENTLSEVLISGNALASKKNGDTRILSSSDAVESLAAKPIQNGNPSNGWTSFNTYMREQLRQKGFKTYNVNISFDLDLLMRPTKIEIKTSSNPKMNAIIVDILKNGPTWENKDPNHPIFIRINSEEAH